MYKRLSFCWQLLPFLGSIWFVLLYFMATLFYPGGTHANKNARGFSWAENYWCNLLSEEALNGQYNPARPIAFAAMTVLSLALSVFWYRFPELAGFRPEKRRLFQASGCLAMVIGFFIFTPLHDTLINIAGLFGMIALVGTLMGLRKLKWTGLFYGGILVVVLIGANNFLYYGSNHIDYLAVVQKFTFLYFLLWISLINISWRKQPPGQPPY